MNLIEHHLVGMVDAPEPREEGKGGYDAECDPVSSLRTGSLRLELGDGRVEGVIGKGRGWRRRSRLPPGHVALAQAALGSNPCGHGGRGGNVL